MAIPRGRHLPLDSSPTLQQPCDLCSIRLTTENVVCTINAIKGYQRSESRYLLTGYLLNEIYSTAWSYLEEDENLRIAVLDDNLGIGEMLQTGLELSGGHTVVTFFNPSKFLETLVESTTISTPFDLLIVDLFLNEGISGVDVIHQVWKTFPNLPVILISAASSWQIEPARRALPGVNVLQKPFSLATLLAMVEDLST